MKFVGWCSAVIGVLMFAQWTFFLSSGSVPEVRTAPVALAFHLLAEAVTAIALLVAGVLILSARGTGTPVGLVAHGLLIYTVIVSPGYFAQTGQWPLVGMFSVLLGLSVACVVALLRAPRSGEQVAIASGHDGLEMGRSNP